MGKSIRQGRGFKGRDYGKSIGEEDFWNAVKALEEQGVAFVREPVERGGGLSVQFRDPDGILLELFTGDDGGTDEGLGVSGTRGGRAGGG